MQKPLKAEELPLEYYNNPERAIIKRPAPGPIIVYNPLHDIFRLALNVDLESRNNLILLTVKLILLSTCFASALKNSPSTPLIEALFSLQNPVTNLPLNFRQTPSPSQVASKYLYPYTGMMNYRDFFIGGGAALPSSAEDNYINRKRLLSLIDALVASDDPEEQDTPSNSPSLTKRE